MTSKNWKEILHPGIVKYIPKDAKLTNGVPNIATITRAAIKADESGEYSEPRIFTNEEIIRQVSLVHEGGTKLNCVRWYRNNLGPRKQGSRAGFREAYALFKEQGNSISQEDLAAIAEANLPIIFGARGADLTILSNYNIMEAYREVKEAKRQQSINEKLAKARASRKLDKEKAAAEEALKQAALKESVDSVTTTEEAAEKIKKPGKKLSFKKS